jgi:hypothetical protein
MRKKLCQWCGKEPAAVPINRDGGRFMRQICSTCHSQRLKGDMAGILLHEAKRRRDADQGGTKG